jgi:hypothetical protein
MCAGVFLKVHNKFDPSAYDQMLVMPGTRTSIGLEAKQYFLMERPRDQGGQMCVDNSESMLLLLRILL